MIGKLLGHTQVQTTARYAHLAAGPVKAAAAQVWAVIARAVIGETLEKAVAMGNHGRQAFPDIVRWLLCGSSRENGFE